jgi:hypothetical protein
MMINKPLIQSLVASAFMLMANLALAEINEGTVLSAKNIDALYEDTFEGHKIKDLLTEKIEWRIRENGFEMPLVHSKKVEMDPKWIERSNANATTAKLNEKTRQVEGWQGGMPFPNIDESDPKAAEKIVWNWYYGNPRGDVMNVPNLSYVLIDGDSGIERTQSWSFIRYTMKGRMSGEQTQGDGKALSRTLFFATAPRDIKGLGTYTVREDSDKVEDVWAYIRAVRRTRRLSGGAWMDPIGGTDQLQDDIEIFNANPSWYKSYKLIAKRHILVSAHGKHSAWKVGAKTQEEEYPTLDLQTAPYWNFNHDNYEPREVYVIEAITPEEHPYSKKIIYVDTQYPRVHLGEAYDKKGEFWKMFQFHSYPGTGEDGFRDIRTTAGVTIDFKRNHATVFFPDTTTWSTNTPGLEMDDVNLGALRKGAR